MASIELHILAQGSCTKLFSDCSGLNSSIHSAIAATEMLVGVLSQVKVLIHTSQRVAGGRGGRMNLKGSVLCSSLQSTTKAGAGADGGSGKRKAC